MSIAPPPRISVVIPTYQRRERVVVAIDSALAQTVSPAEVVVVDDGSTDGTAEEVRRRYGERVRVMAQANRGPAAARNAGIEVATGDAVAFLDSDNRWRDHHLAVLSELLERFPEAVLVGTQRRFRFGDEDASEARPEDLAEDLLLKGPRVGLTTSVGVRRDAFVAAGGYDEGLRYGEDTELFARLAVLGPMALVSATTFERGIEPDSLFAEGRRKGAYVGLIERCADGALGVLDRSPRPDAGRLREAALAARALGRLTLALDRGESAPVLRRHAEDTCGHRPALADDPQQFLELTTQVLPRWGDVEWRLAALGNLAEAWPSRRGSAALRPHVLKAAVASRRWRTAAKALPGLVSRGAAQEVARTLARRRRPE